MTNLTIVLNEELAEKMKQFPDVNWSAVGRDCIEQYIKMRSAGSLEDAIAAVKNRRGEDFNAGYRFIVDNIKGISNAALETLAFYNGDETVLSDQLSDDLAGKIFSYSIENYVTTKSYKVSINFLNGMIEAAKKLLEGSE